MSGLSAHLYSLAIRRVLAYYWGSPLASAPQTLGGISAGYRRIGEVSDGTKVSQREGHTNERQDRGSRVPVTLESWCKSPKRTDREP